MDSLSTSARRLGVKNVRSRHRQTKKLAAVEKVGVTWVTGNSLVIGLKEQYGEDCKVDSPSHGGVFSDFVGPSCSRMFSQNI